ncbi:hypothetical protein [Flavobacterium chungangense]|uniref:DUF4221 domain-containing protein n=1 Tax=Flavobacterium chungangense TaxID=554283 RepID=A0A6V6ZA60_9FLAO|nr:hypothetical protein [Flavobacterium chungangense]CAD0008630.1 hypothetical protein FLACHUCJ7_03865 [Flavobacterium chungangense]
MKLTYKTLAITFASLFLFSCVNDPSNPKDDDFSYLTVDQWGQINKIGNNSGKITSYDHFDGIKTNIINLNTVASNTDKIFLVEHYPAPNDNLFIFDRITRKTTSKKLIYPNEIAGDEPSLISLTWDESKKTLYGIVIRDLYNTAKNNSYFVKIDPNTFEVSYLGLNFDQSTSQSSFLNGNKLYSTNWTKNTFEINTDDYTAKKVSLFDNSNSLFCKAASYNSDIAYCLKSNSQSGTATITKINLADNSYEDFLENETLRIGGISQGKGFIDKSTSEYLCYLQKDSDYVLLTYNILTKKHKYLKLKSDKSIINALTIIDRVSN